VTIWWVKPPKKYIAFISVGIQWTMAILLAGIPYGLHTKPPSKYYATPSPVCYFQMNYLYSLMLIFYLVLVLDRSRLHQGSNCSRICLVLGDIIRLHYLIPPSLLIASGGYQAGYKMVFTEAQLDTCRIVDRHMASISLLL
jgi:hypothetical protein